MHGISFGSTNLPYLFGQLRGFSGNHGIARGHHHDDCGDVKAQPGAILSSLSGYISTLGSQLESLSTSRELPTDGAGAVSASAMGAQIINKQRGELQIHTQEGDVVTLKFSSKVGVRIEGEQISDGDATLTSTSLDVHSRSRIAVSVEGDLSDEELSAINDLVDKISDLSSEFFSGGADGALSQVMILSYDTSVLADYSLDLSLKQSVRAYTYAAAWLPPKPTETSPADEPSAAEGVSQAPTEPLAEAATAAPVEAPADNGSNNAPATTMISADAAPDNATSSPAQILADFVASVRSSLRVTAAESSLGMSYEFKVKLLISSIAASAPAEKAPDNSALGYLQEQLGAGTDTTV